MKYEYIKLRLPYTDIYKIINNRQYKNVIIHIDLLSISKGFYNKATAQLEIERFLTAKQDKIKNYKPTIFIDELKNFLNGLFNSFKFYNPKFILFFDDGVCKQNSDLLKSYKGGRSSSYSFIEDDGMRDLLRTFKTYYFKEISKRFKKSNLSYVIYPEEYESDAVPHYIISKNILNSADPKTLNIILSTDKDLLQTCNFNNVIQCISSFTKGKVEMNVYDDANAISYIYKNFKRGKLTSKYIPLILALAGDKADEIDGLEGVGPAKAIKLIIEHSIDFDFNDKTVLPSNMEQYRDTILLNFKLTSFESQIERIPRLILDWINQEFE